MCLYSQHRRAGQEHPEGSLASQSPGSSSTATEEDSINLWPSHTWAHMHRHNQLIHIQCHWAESGMTANSNRSSQCSLRFSSSRTMFLKHGSFGHHVSLSQLSLTCTLTFCFGECGGSLGNKVCTRGGRWYNDMPQGIILLISYQKNTYDTCNSMHKHTYIILMKFSHLS